MLNIMTLLVQHTKRVDLGGGVKKAKIDYYDQGALDIREVREELSSCDDL